MLPSSGLNALRKQALEGLSAQRGSHLILTPLTAKPAAQRPVRLSVMRLRCGFALHGPRKCRKRAYPKQKKSSCPSRKSKHTPSFCTLAAKRWCG